MISIINRLSERRALTGVISGIIVLACTFWFGNRPTLNILEEEKLERVPDFFLEGVVSKTYGVDGKLQQTITSDTTNHYTEQKTELVNPNIRRINNDIITVATADSGTIIDESQSFSLTENANITRLENDKQTAQVRATKITYNDDAQTIFGEGNSEFITQQGTTHSDTVTFDILKDTATLNGGVTSRYDVSKP